jgi:hypothetical protein
MVVSEEYSVPREFEKRGCVRAIDKIRAHTIPNDQHYMVVVGCGATEAQGGEAEQE